MQSVQQRKKRNLAKNKQSLFYFVCLGISLPIKMSFPKLHRALLSFSDVHILKQSAVILSVGADSQGLE